MRNRDKVLFPAMLACVALALAACSGNGEELDPDAGGTETVESLETMEPVTFIASTLNGEGGFAGQGLKAFAAEIEEKTNGKVTFELYFSGSLLPGEESLTGVRDGIADFTQLNHSYFAEELPVSNWLLGMGSVGNRSYPLSLFAGSAALSDFFGNSPILQEEFDNNGLKILHGISSSNHFDLLCTTPVETLEQAAGLRARTGVPTVAREAEALGMTSVTVSIAETYEGLQRGVIDCQTGSPSVNIPTGLWEVANYYTPVTFSNNFGQTLVMNLDKWNRLPADVQQIISDAAYTEWTVRMSGTTQENKRFAEEGPEAHNIQFLNPAELQGPLIEFQQSELAQLPASAPAAVTDPEGFMKEFEDAITRWENRVVELYGVPTDIVTGDQFFQAYLDYADLDVRKLADLVQESAK